MTRKTKKKVVKVVFQLIQLAIYKAHPMTPIKIDFRKHSSLFCESNQRTSFYRLLYVINFLALLEIVISLSALRGGYGSCCDRNGEWEGEGV